MLTDMQEGGKVLKENGGVHLEIAGVWSYLEVQQAYGGVGMHV